MCTEDMQLFWDHCFWANARILATAEQLTAEQLGTTPPLGGARSLHDTLLHTLNNEQGWREGLRGTLREEVTRFTADQLPDVAAMRAAWADSDAAMRDWLAELDDATLADDSPVPGEPLWHLLAHVANHSMQHRSEAAMLLTHFGRSPGDVDLLFYLDERAGRPKD